MRALERRAQVREREPGVDDVLDDEHVPPRDVDLEVLEDPHDARRVGRRAVARDRHEVDLAGHGQLAHQVGDEEDRALEDADEQQIAALVVRRDLGAELDDAAPQGLPSISTSPTPRAELGPRVPRADGALPAGRLARPGTVTTSSSAHDERPVVALARGTFASTSTSCTFCERPASRSPGRRARTTSPRHGRISSAPRRPTRRCPLEPQHVVLAHRPDAAAEIGAARSGRRGASSTSEASSARGSRGRSSREREEVRSARADRARRAAARAAHGSARASSSAFVESIRHASPLSRQYASVSSRQTASSGRTTPSARRGADPARRAARDDAVEDRLDLVRGGVAGRAQPAAGRRRRSAGRAARPLFAAARPRSPRRRRPPRRCAASRVGLGPANAVVDVDRAAREYPSARSTCQRHVESAPPETRHVTSPPGSISPWRRMCASTRAATSTPGSVPRAQSTCGASAKRGAAAHARSVSAARATASAENWCTPACATGRREPPGSRRRTRRARTGSAGSARRRARRPRAGEQRLERGGVARRPRPRGSRRRLGTAPRADGSTPRRGSARADRPRRRRSGSRRAAVRRSGHVSVRRARSSVSCVRASASRRRGRSRVRRAARRARPPPRPRS